MARRRPPVEVPEKERRIQFPNADGHSDNLIDRRRTRERRNAKAKDRQLDPTTAYPNRNQRADGTVIFEDGSWSNERTGRHGGERSMPWTDTDTGKVYPSRGQEGQRRVAESKDQEHNGAPGPSAKKEAARRMLMMAKAKAQRAR